MIKVKMLVSRRVWSIVDGRDQLVDVVADDIVEVSQENADILIQAGQAQAETAKRSAPKKKQETESK